MSITIELSEEVNVCIVEQLNPSPSTYTHAHPHAHTHTHARYL